MSNLARRKEQREKSEGSEDRLNIDRAAPGGRDEKRERGGGQREGAPDGKASNTLAPHTKVAAAVHGGIAATAGGI